MNDTLTDKAQVLRDRPIPTVALPSRVYKKDIRWYKGLFVAANVGINEDGSPKFGTVDSEKVQQMWESRTCQLCGQRIAKKDFACFPGQYGMGKYVEAPLHVECCKYSLSVCPMIKSKRASFGVSICIDYDIVEFKAPFWQDPGVVPNMSKYPEWASMALQFAHNITANNRCDTCPSWAHEHYLGALTYDEFMFWGERV